MDKLTAMATFVRVVETGSFSAVARERSLGQPAVSKQIAALEAELGTELLHRNSRALTPTEAGNEFYSAARHMLEELESATTRIGRAQNVPRGLVRVGVPPAFARLHMVTKLASFFERYPEVSVEFGTCESLSAVIEEGFDFVIHAGELPDSELIARRFAQTLMVVVATPQFMMRHGLPSTLEELRHVPAIPFVANGGVQTWQFAVDGRVEQMMPAGVFRTMELEQLRMGVLEHLGIAQAPAWLFAAELREGTVLRTLVPYERVVPLYSVRPAGRKVPARVRVLLEHLEETFALCTQFNPRPSLSDAKIAAGEA